MAISIPITRHLNFNNILVIYKLQRFIDLCFDTPLSNANPVKCQSSIVECQVIGVCEPLLKAFGIRHCHGKLLAVYDDEDGHLTACTLGIRYNKKIMHYIARRNGSTG